MIKAIQTKYKGYHFRSRLEARWAVFFDALGIEWEYEPEGFELSDGTRYLPDFWLASHNPKSKGSYVEVKPSGNFGDFKKAELFSADSGYDIILLDGIPDTCLYLAKRVSHYDTCRFLRNPARVAYLPYHDGWKNKRRNHLTWPGIEVDASVDAARSARFEHGQCGATA